MFLIESNGVITRIPVDLPRGSKKQVTVNLQMGYPPPTAQLITDRGSFEAKIPENMGSEPGVLLVSDNAAGLGLKKPQSRGRVSNEVALQELFVKPELLPERASAYYGIAAVILADGAERLSDAAFDALRNYMLLGGTILISGGASAPVLVDSRWRPFLPVTDTGTKTLTSRARETISGLSLQGEFTVRLGRVHPDAAIKTSYRGMPMVVSRGFGAGRILFVAFNPFERPIDSWPGKGEFLQALNFTSSYKGMEHFLASANLGSEYGYGYSSSSGYSGVYSGQPDDPFEAKPPETANVIMILLIYVVLVVPLNLITLRKLGKGEWAWVTTPIISLGFAAVFFRFAAGLYSADMSLFVVGTVVGDERSNTAYFLGNTQMFFPRGGGYDLKMDGIEMAMNQERGYGFGSRASQPIELVDGGQLRIPSMQVTNLAFREFSFGQTLPSGRWVSLSKVGLQVTVTNVSPYTLSGIEVRTPDYLCLANTLAPGKSWKGKLIKSKQKSELSGAMGSSANRIKVSGLMTGIRPGPRIGKLSDRRSAINFVYFLEGTNE
ncbi:MAG: hypothetical protein ABL962_01080 [Fimbriimonadaceae bacterium]